MRMLRAAIFLLALLPAAVDAKGETTRIEIASGKRPFVTLEGADTAGQFTIWSGPGTHSTQSSGAELPSTSRADIADWEGGPVEPPTQLAVFKVRFFCAAEQEPQPSVPTSHQCYGVYYAIDPETGAAFVRIPPARDREFPDNAQTIYRGVEGSWYRASAHWEALVRPQIDAQLKNEPHDAVYYQQPYIYTAPAHTAVSAKPLVTPKK